MVSFPLKASPLLQLDYSLYLQQLCTLLLRVSPRIPGTESISSEKSNWSQFCTRVREATVATAPWLYPALHCNVVWICPVLAPLPWRQNKRKGLKHPPPLLTIVFRVHLELADSLNVVAVDHKTKFNSE